MLPVPNEGKFQMTEIGQVYAYEAMNLFEIGQK